MPANYNYQRLIGWFKRVGGTIVAFHTYELEGGGLEFLWDAPTLDINLSNTLTTSRRTDAVKVPLNVSVLAILDVQCFDAAASHFDWIGCPDAADVAPAGIGTANFEGDAAGRAIISEFVIRTSATGLIAARSSLATVDTYQVSTKGFKWTRRD
jgi:hypothetical protein